MAQIGNSTTGASTGSQPAFVWANKAAAFNYTALGPDLVTKVWWFGTSIFLHTNISVEIWTIVAGLPAVRVGGPYTFGAGGFGGFQWFSKVITPLVLSAGTTYTISWYDCTPNWTAPYTIIANSTSVHTACPSTDPYTNSLNSFRSYACYAEVTPVTPAGILYPCCAQLI